MNKLTKKDYDTIVKGIKKKSIFEIELISIEELANEFDTFYKKHIKSNPDFLENLIEAYNYANQGPTNSYFNNEKYDRALLLFLKKFNKIESIKPNENKKSAKLRWNGNSNQLYYLLKQLTELKTSNDLPYLNNTAEELAYFIENFVDGIDAKLSSIKSEIVRKSNIPRKGKRLVIEVK